MKKIGITIITASVGLMTTVISAPEDEPVDKVRLVLFDGAEREVDNNEGNKKKKAMGNKEAINEYKVEVPKDADGKPLKFESRHRFIARYTGTDFHTCRGATLMCPETCGSSGEYARFGVVDYLHFSKRDGKDVKKETTHSIHVSDFHRKAIGDETRNMIVDGLKKGDLVLIEWQHLSGKIGKASFGGIHPLLHLKKITQDEANKLRVDATKEPAVTPPKDASIKNFPLMNTRWVLQGFEVKKGDEKAKKIAVIDARRTPHLQIAKSEKKMEGSNILVSGSGGVNHFSGMITKIDKKAGKITVGSLRSSLMGGDPEEMKQEFRCLEISDSVLLYKIEGDTLTLEKWKTGEIHKLIFKAKSVEEEPPNPKGLKKIPLKDGRKCDDEHS